MVTGKMSAKSKTETQVQDESKGVTLEHALKEAGEGRMTASGLISSSLYFDFSAGI